MAISGLGPNWRYGRQAALTIDRVKEILTQAFCDEIPTGSIVSGSCNLQVLSYDPVTGVADYLVTFDIIELEQLTEGLNTINEGITAGTNQAIQDSGQSVSSGTIGKCICILIPLYHVSIFVEFFYQILPTQPTTDYISINTVMNFNKNGCFLNIPRQSFC